MQKTNKQDKQAARTPADLERKYRFGKSLTEVRVVTSSAQSAAAEATRAVARLDQKLDGAEIASRLANARLASADEQMVLDFPSGTASFGKGIRLGKTTLFSGDLPAGETADIPGAADFDLFAVTLSTEDAAVSHTLLAWKAQSILRGLGGADGTLFWFTATETEEGWQITQAQMTTANTTTPLRLTNLTGIV